MNVASYIKFDDITNALIDIKPTKLVADGSAEFPQLDNLSRPNKQNFLLDTSFDLNLAFTNALDKLQQQQQQQLASATSTPALGEYKLPNCSPSFLLGPFPTFSLSPSLHLYYLLPVACCLLIVVARAFYSARSSH